MSINTLTDNYFKPWLNARVNNLTVDGTFIAPGADGVFNDITVADKIKRTILSQTQLTSISTTVTFTSTGCGLITTYPLSGTDFDPSTTLSFNVVNPLVGAGDVVLITLQNISPFPSSPGGFPIINVNQVQNGNFTIKMYNPGPTAVTGTFIIAFEIISQI